MAYAQLDEHFDEHPKFERLELEHYGLMACAISYCNRLLTDGFVSDKAVRGFGMSGRAARVAQRLLDQNIWRRVDNGYEVVGFLDHNPSRSEVLARREAARARKEAQRKRDVTRDVPRDASRDEDGDRPSDTTQSSQVTSRGGAIHCTAIHGTADRSKSSSESTARSATRRSKASPKTALPPSFAVSPAIASMCRDEGLPNPHEVLREFCDKALAKDYRYADWEAAFRTWMRSPITRERYRPWSNVRSRTDSGQLPLNPAPNSDADSLAAPPTPEEHAQLEALLADLDAATSIGSTDSSNDTGERS